MKRDIRDAYLAIGFWGIIVGALGFAAAPIFI